MENIIYSHMRCKGRISLIVRNRKIFVQENVSFTPIVRKSTVGAISYNTSETTPNQQIYDFNGLMINNDNHKCTLYDQPLNLTPLEFSILWYLCSKKGSVVTSEELFEAVWQEKYLDNNNTVMAHVARLREKMHENARKPKFIKTVWGVGYTIE